MKRETRRPRHDAGDDGRIEIAAFSATAFTAVSELMTRVRCVSQDMSVETVTTFLLDNGLAAVPVAEDGKLTGILTLAELARVRFEQGDTESRSWRGFAYDPGVGFHPVDLARATVGQIMLPCPLAVTPDMPIHEAAGSMASCGLDRIPVVEESCEVVGMLAAQDILRWIAEQHGIPVARPFQTRGDDDEDG